MTYIFRILKYKIPLFNSENVSKLKRKNHQTPLITILMKILNN